MYSVHEEGNVYSGEFDPSPSPPRGQKPKLGLLIVTVVLVSAITGGLAGGAFGYWAAQASAPELPAVDQPAPLAAAQNEAVVNRDVDAPVEEPRVIEREVVDRPTVVGNRMGEVPEGHPDLRSERQGQQPRRHPGRAGLQGKFPEPAPAAVEEPGCEQQHDPG